LCVALAMNYNNLTLANNMTVTIIDKQHPDWKIKRCIKIAAVSKNPEVISLGFIAFQITHVEEPDQIHRCMSLLTHSTQLRILLKH
ncbi:20500_t:CDS:2, partial [Racocetra persica]